MAVRLRGVAASNEEEHVEAAPEWGEALRPSTRIMGGRIADKLGSRMGLRLSEDRFLPDRQDGDSLTFQRNYIDGLPASVPSQRRS